MSMSYETRLAAGIEFLRKLACDSVAHSRRNLLEHLTGTHDLLRSWSASETVCLAGLFHSVYGTEGFRAKLAELPDRKVIAGIIGEESEALAWLFGMRVNRSYSEQLRILNTTNALTFTLVNRLTGESIPCARDDMLRLVDMDLANAFDQAQHIPEHYTEPKRAGLRSLLPLALPGAAATFAKLFGTPPAQFNVLRSQAAGSGGAVQR